MYQSAAGLVWAVVMSAMRGDDKSKQLEEEEQDGQRLVAASESRDWTAHLEVQPKQDRVAQWRQWRQPSHQDDRSNQRVVAWCIMVCELYGKYLLWHYHDRNRKLLYKFYIYLYICLLSSNFSSFCFCPKSDNHILKHVFVAKSSLTLW